MINYSTIKLKDLYYLILILFMPCCFFAQEQIEFTKHQDFYINGDATIIGNNIVSKHETKPFNDFALINDQVKMKYVDIDHETSTFSSSSASLNITGSNVSIKSAILYWSAVYPFEKGVKRETSKEIYYDGNDVRDDQIHQIKFKTPSSDYIDVEGSIIYDGFNSKTHKDSAPYVCFADVTEIMKTSNTINGEYVIGNVRATQGFVSGGSAAGWFLFIIYESPEATSKYITTFHGFSSLNDNSVDIAFSDFRTIKKGNVNASIFVATLEGDSKLSRDQCSIFRSKDSSYIPLKNKLRSPKNFFNSKISIDNRFFTQRNPNSANTLGFDLLQLKIPNGILLNNQTKTVLRLGTKADRFHLFFTAFKTEINEVFHINKEAIDLTEVETQIEEKHEVEIKMDSTEAETKELSISEIEKHLKQVKLRIPSVDKGYYLITNVFSKSFFTKKWEEFLLSKGYTPKHFTNPKNNWQYVHVYNNEDIRAVYKTYQKLVKLDYFKEIWVFKINID